MITTVKPIPHNEMTDEHKKFMEESRLYHGTLIRTGAVRNMNLGGMIEIMKTYYEPDLYLDRTNIAEITAFVKRLYIHYERYLATPKSPKRFTPGQNIYLDKDFR